MNFSNLSKEQISKASGCKTPEEVMAVVREEGIELTDEQLDAVAGGGSNWAGWETCPQCGSTRVTEFLSPDGFAEYSCFNCSYYWRNEGFADGPEVTGHK